jgi:hypothetical protein
MDSATRIGDMIRQIALGIFLIGFTVPALAQSNPQAGPDSSSFTLGDYGARRKAPKPPSAADDPSLVHRPAEHWPWLEPGTVVCHTQDELDRYRASVAARLDGQSAPSLVAECRRLTRRTPIDIADRHGPATTEIHLYNDAKQTAWTDVWLPAQRPN